MSVSQLTANVGETPNGATLPFTMGSSAEITEFGRRHDVEREAKLAVDLIKKHFGDCPIQLTVEQDPDSNDEWLGIDVYPTTPNEIAEAAYHAYGREWMGLESTPQKKLLIRLNCFYK